MTRRLLLLNGLAILAVVCNHTIAWGFTAMFWWTDRYRPVTVPNFDQLGTVPFYTLVVLRQLTVFAVPTFLFVSGFFIAYAARGSQSVLTWKGVRVRITNLLIPYLLWSILIFTGEMLQGETHQPVEYLKRLALGGAYSAYFYVPLLCQFYLLAPFLVPFARSRWRGLLAGAALLQLGIISLSYLNLFGIAPIVSPNILRFLNSPWLFLKWSFFFTFGIVFGFHLHQIRPWLTRYKWGLLAAVLVFGLLTIIEPEIILRSTGQDWHSYNHIISGTLYALAFALCFLAFYQVSVPYSETFFLLGKNSYGIYLLHPLVLEYGARAIRLLLPLLLAYQILFQPLLVLLAVGGPLLLMAIIAKSSMRRSYRYLFG